MWKRYRFYTYAVDDYRPLIFNPKYPWWCSGHGEDEKGENSVIIAYLPENENLLEYWDDAYNIDVDDCEEIEFSSRFPKPEYFVES